MSTPEFDNTPPELVAASMAVDALVVWAAELNTWLDELTAEDVA